MKSPVQNSVIHAGEAVLDQGAAQNDVQPVEEPDSSKYPVGPRLGCSPRLVCVPNVMDREPSSKILARHAEDEEAFKRPGKSSYASLKESMTEHTSVLAGQGEHPAGVSQSGDLYVVVHMKKHPVFERRGADLYRKLTISFPQATLGANLSVGTLQGNERLKIPEGTESGSLFKLKGSGMPKIRGSGHGDLYVLIQVKTPKRLNKRAKLLLEEFQRELENNDENYK